MYPWRGADSGEELLAPEAVESQAEEDAEEDGISSDEESTYSCIFGDSSASESDH